MTRRPSGAAVRARHRGCASEPSGSVRAVHDRRSVWSRKPTSRRSRPVWTGRSRCLPYPAGRSAAGEAEVPQRADARALGRSGLCDLAAGRDAGGARSSRTSRTCSFRISRTSRPISTATSAICRTAATRLTACSGSCGASSRSCRPGDTSCIPNVRADPHGAEVRGVSVSQLAPVQATRRQRSDQRARL